MISKTEKLVARLKALASEGRSADIVATVETSHLWRRLARHQAKGGAMGYHSDSLSWVAEAYGLALIEIDRASAFTIDTWILPLLQRLKADQQKTVAVFLARHLSNHPDPQQIVRGIEAAFSDESKPAVSTLHEVFASTDWPLMRTHLASPFMIDELERHVTRENRREFWKNFGSIT